MQPQLQREKEQTFSFENDLIVATKQGLMLSCLHDLSPFESTTGCSSLSLLTDFQYLNKKASTMHKHCLVDTSVPEAVQVPLKHGGIEEHVVGGRTGQVLWRALAV